MTLKETKEVDMSILMTGIIIVSLFFLHEMDAIRAKEWKMFIFFKNMREETAYKIFAGVHFPLYLIMLFFIIQDNDNTRVWFFIVLDILLILHTFVHFLFRNNKNNGFLSLFSKVIIYLTGIAAILNFILLILNNI